MIYTKIQLIQCINSKGTSAFCIVNNDKACISTELVDFIYNKVEKNQVLWLQTIQQELCKPQKQEYMELDEKQKKNPYETLLIQDIKEQQLKPMLHMTGEIVNI